MSIYERCGAALSARLRQVRPQAAWIDGYQNYVANVEDNLLADIQLFREDFKHGAGKELEWTRHLGRDCPPKLQAAHSSAALAVNTFARWKATPPELALAGNNGFRSLNFEARCPTGLHGTPPHLDLLAKGPKGASVAVESKCIEYLNGHNTDFPVSYDSLQGPGSQTEYFKLIDSLRANPKAFKRLDAPQLVKHALGLATCFPDEQVTLLYLFWEPVNWHLFRPFQEHRDEMARFAEVVAGCQIRITCMSYPDLWAAWKGQAKPSWLGPQVASLTDRYLLTI
ncbi:MAG: hypothetical protein SGI92_26880 [Bryobacteraceae bacterium]|nr:hypothetical protein [Bryobacteraceae bacterium]